MRSTRSALLLAAAAAVVSVAGISAARAGVIYQDNFGRNGSLAGSSPAPTDATASTWTVLEQSDQMTSPTTNDSVAVFASGNYLQAAYLPFTPQANAAYAFTVTITPNTNTNSNWLGMGFGNSAGTVAATNTLMNNSTTEAWLIYLYNGGTQSFYGGGTNNQMNGATGTAGAPDTFTITLTTPADLATGTASVSMYDSLGLIGSSQNPRTGTLTAAELANVDSIIVGNQYVGGTFAGWSLAVRSLNRRHWVCWELVGWRCCWLAVNASRPA